MSLPTLCDPVTVKAMLAQETHLLDLATSFVESYTQVGFHKDLASNLQEHLNAIAHINEISFCHESEHPADREIHASAMQLKAWHLSAIDDALTV